MTVARATDLWDQVAPDVFRRVVEIFAAAGQGVLITPVPDSQLIEWEETEK